MRIDIATLFPDMCGMVLAESIVGRAAKRGILDIRTHNIRDYTLNKHRRVDDTLYGGGMGMLLQAEPIYRCYRDVCGAPVAGETGQTAAFSAPFEGEAARVPMGPHVIYLSPKGKTLTQKRAGELAQKPWVFLLCGHYEGVDQRILDAIVDEEISIGDYVLTGGELPALVLADCIARQVPGVLPSEECFQEESHYSGLLEHPQYTKPEVWRGVGVPEVLLSGHHARIGEWKRAESERITGERRPELLQKSREKS